MKTFQYWFCNRSRRFVVRGKEDAPRKRNKKRGQGRNRRVRNRRDRDYGTRSAPIETRHDEKVKKDSTSQLNSTVEPKILLKSGYLKNRKAAKCESELLERERNAKNSGLSMGELMGKLWLENEVKTLESKVKPSNPLVMTPYLVVDAKSLTSYIHIVKNLIKTQQFVILIPNALLSELDRLKKQSDGARNAIRWLEKEFGKGNRFIRSQRANETKTLQMVKVPRKLDHEGTGLLQIAQFCDFMVSNNSNGIGLDGDNVLTLLVGEHLGEKKVANVKYLAILDSISVKWDQIDKFYRRLRSNDIDKRHVVR